MTACFVADMFLFQMDLTEILELSSGIISGIIHPYSGPDTAGSLEGQVEEIAAMRSRFKKNGVR